MHGAERQSLLAQLVHADEEVRRLAVERTTLLPPSDALPLLVERLGDASWRVRKAAVARLAALPERAAAVSALLEAIADGEDPGRRNAALEALVACGRSATPLLARELGSADVDVRKQVVDVLGAIADPRAEEPLARALDDADPNVRAAAADALAELGSVQRADALVRLASEDPEKLVRVAALRALVRVEAAIPPALVAAALADPLLAPAGYAALALGGAPEAIETIAKGLLARRASAREAAANAATSLFARASEADAPRIAQQLRSFAAAHEAVAREACERLDDAAPSGRLAAVQFVALLEAPRSAASLARCASDGAVLDPARAALAALGSALPPALGEAWPQLAPAERAFACSALGACGADAAAERMLRAALLDPSSEVRAAAARALARCGTAESLGDLLARLADEESDAGGDSTDEEADALVDAVVRLAERAGAEAVDAAMALVDSRLARGPERARIAAARLLARLARGADVARMRALLSDASERVRRAAVEAIPRIGVAGAELLRIAVADEAPAVRSAAALRVAQLGLPSADEDLAALAEDRDVRVRSAAMNALAARASEPGGRAHALALLANALRGEGVVALAALAALQRIGGPDCAAIAALGLRSQEPEIVERAAACVGAHGGAPLRGELIALLAHPAWPVRARAVTELAAQRAATALPQLHARLAEESDDFVRNALLSALASLES